jgi:formiminotetrahydrofolate cyclodeaminase
MTAYKTKDDKALNKASIEAAQVPAQLLELTQSIEVISDFLSRKGNKTVVSDARIAFDLCKSIYNGCILNIKANLSGITDNKAKEKLNAIIELFSERI